MTRMIGRRWLVRKHSSGRGSRRISPIRVCGADRYSVRSFSWKAQKSADCSPWRSTIRMWSPASTRNAIPVRAGRWCSNPSVNPSVMLMVAPPLRPPGSQPETQDPDRVRPEHALLLLPGEEGQRHDALDGVIEIVPGEVGAEHDPVRADVADQAGQRLVAGCVRGPRPFDDLAAIEGDVREGPRQLCGLAPRPAP